MTWSPSYTPTLSPTPWASDTWTPTPIPTNFWEANTCMPMDNFESGTLVNLLGGTWSGTAQGAASVVSPSNVLGGANGTNRCLQFGGSNASVDNASSWGLRGTGSSVQDLSTLTAVAFWVKASSPTNLRVGFSSDSITDGDDFGVGFSVTTGWNYLTLPVASMTQTGSGAPVNRTIALTSVGALEFKCLGQDATPVTVWLDEVCLAAPNQAPTPIATYFGTPGATPEPDGNIYVVPIAQVAAALGASTALVQQVRDYRMDSFTTYLVVRMSVMCGCSVSSIMAARLNMGWDAVAASLGVPWAALVQDVQARMSGLPPEWDTPAMIIRGTTNNPLLWPSAPPPLRPSAGLVLPASSQGGCP